MLAAARGEPARLASGPDLTMKPLLLILCLSLAGLTAALLVPGWADLILIALPSALASAVLLLRELRNRLTRPPSGSLIIDGSNVMYWRDNTPHLSTVKDVVHHLQARGFGVEVFFDANAGYLLANKYQHDAALSRQLGLPKSRVTVVPKGTPADPLILTAARDRRARVITNDRFRDWAGDYPQITAPGFLIKGGFGKNGLWLNERALAVPG